MRIVDGSRSNYIKEVIKEYKKSNQNDDIHIVSSADSLDILLDYIELDNPEVVIVTRDLDDDPQGENLVKAIRDIRITKPLLRFIILAPKYNRRFFQKLVNLGIYSIIIYDDIDEELMIEITKPSSEYNFEKYEAKPEKREYINKITKGLKRVIAVYSAAPTGKSFVASNLAYILARQKIKTALVDGDLINRSLSYYYYIQSSKESLLKEILEGGNTKTIEELGYSLLDGNLKVFTTKRLNEQYEDIPIGSNQNIIDIQDRFMSLIDYLRTENEVVFIDVNRNINDEITKKALSLADTVLFVQNLDYMMMDINKASIKNLSKKNISLEKLVLVVNRFIENREFSPKIIERFLEGKFAGRVTIPDDSQSVIKQLRYGKPALSFKECREETIEAFYELSSFCYGIEKIKKRRGGVLSKILG